MKKGKGGSEAHPSRLVARLSPSNCIAEVRVDWPLDHYFEGHKIHERLVPIVIVSKQLPIGLRLRRNRLRL